MNTARASLVLIGSLALAQDPVTPGPDKQARAPEPGHIRADRSGLVLPAGPIDADELVDAVARFLGRSILWTAVEHGKAPVEPFVLQKELALDAPGSEEVLSQLLWSRGFVLVPLHADKGLYEILLQSGPRQGDVFANALVRTPDDILRQPSLRMYVCTQIKIEHVDANTTHNQFAFFGQSNNNRVTVATLGSTLILTGMQDQVAQALRMMKAIDRPQEQPRRTELEVRVAALEKSVLELRRAEAPPTNAPPATLPSTPPSTSGGK